jgi:hypothetical protein
MVELEQSAEALSALDRVPACGLAGWEEKHVSHALVISFFMIMAYELAEGATEAVLAEQHEL